VRCDKQELLEAADLSLLLQDGSAHCMVTLKNDMKLHSTLAGGCEI